MRYFAFALCETIEKFNLLHRENNSNYMGATVSVYVIGEGFTRKSKILNYTK